MKIADSLFHAGTSWFEPIALLVYQMNQNKVDHTVLIQHMGMYDPVSGPIQGCCN
jgi:hypothetical protein